MFLVVRILTAVFLAVLVWRVGDATLPFSSFLLICAASFLGFFLPPRIVVFWEKFITRFTKRVALEVSKQLKKLPSKTKKKGLSSFILDTSALIDGRIGEILRTGFLPGEILLPDFVLRELQKVADSSDPLRRAKGRRGLSILEEMKKEERVKVVKTKMRGKTDENLVKLAERKKAGLVTVDFNLNKVAKVSGVPVLNVNKLAQAVRTLVVPGEELEIKIIAEGKEKDQGVGYLEDGTMVVVEKGKGLIGKKVKVVVSRFLQTEAGRMIFGKFS